jgi:hypothetical protein
MVITPPLGVDFAAALIAFTNAAEADGFFFFFAPAGLLAEAAFLGLAILGFAAAFFALGFAETDTEVVAGMDKGVMVTAVPAAAAAFFVLVFLGGASTLANGASSAEAL